MLTIGLSVDILNNSLLSKTNSSFYVFSPLTISPRNSLGHVEGFMPAINVPPQIVTLPHSQDFTASLHGKLREFIGMVNFYHRFLPSASILQPLNELLTHPRDKSTPLTWTEEAHSAFNRTKEVLAVATLLAHPKPDAPTCLMTDASSSAVGAVLRQLVKNTWHPIAFFSNYITFDRELLAGFT